MATASIAVRMTPQQIQACITSLGSDLECLSREDAVELYGGPGKADAAWRALDLLHEALGHDTREPVHD